MAPPVTKKQKFSSADNRRLISSSSTAPIGHGMGSLVTSFGKRRSLRVAKKMNRTLRTICNDVLMDILPFFGHAQLGLKLALLSPRFNALVDKHFGGKSELTIWRRIRISMAQDDHQQAKFSVRICGKFVKFPWPDHSLPNNIRFKHLRIEYINQSVLEFLRSNKQIFDDGRGTNLRLNVCIYGKIRLIWDFLVQEIWPIFAQNIRQLAFLNAAVAGADLARLRRRISPTMLTDLNHLNSIDSSYLLPDVTNDDDDDGPNKTATAGQALSNWLHTPRKDGQPKQLFCAFRMFSDGAPKPNAWVNNFKEQFRRATTNAVSYKIQFTAYAPPSMVPFELVNERTREKLTLTKAANDRWIIKRCQNGEMTTTAQWTDQQNLNNNLNNVSITLSGANCIWPLLSTPATRKSDRKRTSNCAEVKYN